MCLGLVASESKSCMQISSLTFKQQVDAAFTISNICQSYPQYKSNIKQPAMCTK